MVIGNHFIEVVRQNWPALVDRLSSLALLLSQIREAKGAVFVCGNGGSCANAAHLVLHLREVGIEAHDLAADTPWFTALANDYGYDEIFGKSLKVLGAEEGDLLIVISGSGNSPNVTRALEYARVQKMSRWGLLGMGGGQALALCDGVVLVDSQDYGVVEDIHGACAHALKKSLTIP